jgi:hypothetical protein
MKFLTLILWTILPPTLVLGQSLSEKKMMDLVRVYKRSQDTIYALPKNSESVNFLQVSAEKAKLLLIEIAPDLDTNKTQAAQYLALATRMYAKVSYYEQQRDSNSFAQLESLKTAIDSFDQTCFPIYFSIMGYQIKLR